MAQLPDETIQRIVELRKQGRSYREIGQEMGCDHTTAHKYCRRYMKESGNDARGGGAPQDPLNVPIDDRDSNGGETRILTPDRPKTLAEMAELFGIDESRWIPQTVRANEWQGFYKIADGTGHKKVSLWQTRVTWKRIVPEEVEDAICAFVRDHMKPMVAPDPKDGANVIARRPKGEGQNVAWGMWDAHLGMHAWNSEVGEDYDLKIAARRVMNSIDDMVDQLALYPIKKIWMPIGNDFMHFDSVRHTTTFGEHYLDTDNRYGKVYQEALRCLSYQVEKGLQIADEVEIIYVPGNHDMATSFTLCVALDERFRNYDRVTSDLTFNPRKWRSYGGTLLGFEHGQKCKPAQLALVMAQETKKIGWAEATWCEIQVGHTHQRREQMFASLIPVNGVLIRTNPALCNVDAWHHNKGLIGEPTKSVEAWRYGLKGYLGSHVTCARDDGE